MTSGKSWVVLTWMVIVLSLTYFDKRALTIVQFFKKVFVNYVKKVICE